MKITTSGDFAAPCDQVFAILADEGFQRSIADTPGSTASVATQGDKTLITSLRVMSTAGLPEIAKTFVGSQLKLTEVQTWGPAAADGSRTGTLVLTIEGAPIRVDGNLTLSPTATGCRQSVVGEVKAKIPLVGGKVEQSAAPVLVEGIELEYAAIKQRL